MNEYRTARTMAEAKSIARELGAGATIERRPDTIADAGRRIKGGYVISRAA